MKQNEVVRATWPVDAWLECGLVFRGGVISMTDVVRKLILE